MSGVSRRGPATVVIAGSIGSYARWWLLPAWYPGLELSTPMSGGNYALLTLAIVLGVLIVLNVSYQSCRKMGVFQ